MPWDFDNSKPIYIQLVEELKLRVISGRLAAGSKLDSVRDLAEEAGVNPNTMQRALAELERDQLVYSQRTSGRFVTEDMELIKTMRNQYATTKIKEVTVALLQLGYTKEELLKLIEEDLKEQEEKKIEYI
ncbi:GntR family transcriptional regulator [Cellulosilyticum sp. ST5]|uniref:GntR family transcriptional regulator n=1 Tax=unclassified Cellulosilyticum TaxID=2643091 RepID=UPI000F8EBE38|nr:GntR family transcriptional regulator [Cellulosilyticum sp. WCF-2]QEH67415.1 GntR family transcriptional regulator [Cellulosilyticum sp. WCF-2]